MYGSVSTDIGAVAVQREAGRDLEYESEAADSVGEGDEGPG